MHAAEFPLLSLGEFGLLAAQFPLGAGDVHALAGAHADEVGFELGEGGEDVEEHLVWRSISTLSLTLPSINVDNARLTHPASEFQGLESERRTFRPWDPVDALPPLTLVDFCPARHLELLPRGGVDPQTASVVKMIELLLANDAEAQPTHTMAAPYAGKRD